MFQLLRLPPSLRQLCRKSHALWVNKRPGLRNRGFCWYSVLNLTTCQAKVSCRVIRIYWSYQRIQGGPQSKLTVARNVEWYHYLWQIEEGSIPIIRKEYEFHLKEEKTCPTRCTTKNDCFYTVYIKKVFFLFSHQLTICQDICATFCHRWKI